MGGNTGNGANSGKPVCSTSGKPSWDARWGTGGTQTTTTRTNPAGDTMAPGIVGLGGLGLPDMEHMVNGVPDAVGLNQFLQNSAVSQMMQNLLSNPQYTNQSQPATSWHV